MKQAMGAWGRVLAGVMIWTGALAALPPIPDSLPVTVLIPPGRFQSGPALSTSGVLYTRIEGRDRERIGGPPRRMHPFITYGKDQALDWKWQDAEALAVALDRIGHKDGSLIFEMEDGTWATGSAVGFTVRLGIQIQEKIFLTVSVWDLHPQPNGVLTPKARSMNIPLEDVGDRVFRTPALTETSAPEPGAHYFLAAYDESLLPVTILGIEPTKAWVCATADLSTKGMTEVDKFSVPLELLRRAPRVAADAMYRQAAKKPMPKKGLALFARAEMPDCLAELGARGATEFGKKTE